MEHSHHNRSGRRRNWVMLAGLGAVAVAIGIAIWLGANPAIALVAIMFLMHFGMHSGHGHGGHGSKAGS